MTLASLNDGTLAALQRDEGNDPTHLKENQNMTHASEPASICDVDGCRSYPTTHDLAEGPSRWSHELKPLEGHDFDICPVQQPGEPWGLYVHLPEREWTADDATRLAAVLVAEGARLEVLNTPERRSMVGAATLYRRSRKPRDAVARPWPR